MNWKLSTFSVTKSIRLDATFNQWIDLGTPRDVCLAQPDTCVHGGGTVIMWVRSQPTTSEQPGFISSRSRDLARGFQIGYTRDGTQLQ